MFFCPKCNIPLKKSSGLFGAFWLCQGCSGKAISLSVLRQSAPASIVNEFWSRVKSNDFPEKKNCPACKLPMSEVPIMKGEKSVCIDICKKCYFIWFDANEFESVPEDEIYEIQEKEQLPLHAREALAKLQIKFLADKRRKEEKYEEMARREKTNMLIDLAMYIIFHKI